jgi:hypothetical protein
MVELFLRLVISMAVVMGVMAIAARLLRRNQGSIAGPGRRGRRAMGMGIGAGPGGLPGSGRSRQARPAPLVDVVYRRSLARGASVTVVQAGGQTFLVGVTEQNVTMLAELSPAPAIGASPAGPQAAANGIPANASAQRGPAKPTGEQGPVDDFDEWQGTGGTPVLLTDAANTRRPDNAWKLALDSLRERTVRR